MPTNRELNERFDKLYPQVADVVTNLSRGFARSTNRLLHRAYDAYPNSDDLRQEAALKLLHVLNVYWDRTDEEILQIFPTVILNKFRSIYNSIVFHTSYIEYGPVLDEIAAPIDDSQADLLFNDDLSALLNMQDREFDRIVLRLMVDPDDALLKIIQEDDATAGKFTRNELIIQHEHLARRLKVSRPTISRSLARIREKLGRLTEILNRLR